MILEANLYWQHLDTETYLIMPWYSIPTLQWLKTQPVKEWYVFEYGAGYSTIWYRANVKSVLTVDHQESWAKAMGALHAPDKEEYIRIFAAFSNSKFDLIVVDGEWREECTFHAKGFVKPGGYIIWDNYGQEGFVSPDVIDSILVGWEKTVYRQPNHSSWSTAVFRKPV